MFLLSGVVILDSNSMGIWLLHSTPQFPFRRNLEEFWPESGTVKAQIFLCVTFPYSSFTDIGNQLRSKNTRTRLSVGRNVISFSWACFYWSVITWKSSATISPAETTVGVLNLTTVDLEGALSPFEWVELNDAVLPLRQQESSHIYFYRGSAAASWCVQSEQRMLWRCY